MRTLFLLALFLTAPVPAETSAAWCARSCSSQPNADCRFCCALACECNGGDTTACKVARVHCSRDDNRDAMKACPGLPSEAPRPPR